MAKLIFIGILGGLGAGIGTGLAGLSAAAFIAPLLIGALGMPAYQATAVGLASDVLASAISAVTYKRHGNLDLKRASKMLIMVLTGTVIGSVLAQFMPDSSLGYLSIAGSIFLGMKLILFPENKQGKPIPDFLGKNSQKIYEIVCSLGIGFICGFMGTGGGMMMLFVLTMVMGFELKKAVGTSVFIMAFTAFLGSTLHFTIGGFPDWRILLVCAVVTFFSAWITAKIANVLPAKVSGRVTGILLLIDAVLMFYFKTAGLA